MGSVPGDMGICPENGLMCSDTSSVGVLEDTIGVAVTSEAQSGP